MMTARAARMRRTRAGPLADQEFGRLPWFAALFLRAFFLRDFFAIPDPPNFSLLDSRW